MLLLPFLACTPDSDPLKPAVPSPTVDSAGAADPPTTTDSADTGDSANTAECSATTWTTGRHTLEHGGLERSYRVYVPTTYDPTVPAPLVLAFHGWGGRGAEFIEDTTVTAEADARGYVVVAPDGLGPEEAGRPATSWSFRGSTTGLDGDGANAEVVDDSTAICNDVLTNDYVYPSCHGVAQNGCAWTQCSADDADFAVTLVAETVRNLCIDLERVYAVGGSNGGMFTWELGQNPVSADTFRALAPIIGLPHRGYLDPPARAGTPVILITGTRDRTVPPGEWEDPTYTTSSDGDTYYYTGATAITRVWAESAGCSTTSPAMRVDVGDPELDCRSYCPSTGSLPSILDCRTSNGHVYDFTWSWPLVLEFFDQNH